MRQKIAERALLFVGSLCILSGVVFPLEHVHAQAELLQDTVVVVKARVIEIQKQEVREVPGTDVRSNFQEIRAQILEGEEKGKEVTVENDYLNLKVNEVFYLSHTTQVMDGTDYYAVKEPYRLPHLLWIVALFLAAVFFFGGAQGIRGLISLCGSFLLIFYVLLPGILNGYSPLVVTVVVSSFIIILGSYITHGFTRSTTAAVLGMITTVIITGVFAYFAVHFMRLSGFGSEEAVYLNLNARGSIDILGLLLGGMMVGLLGVLYDAAIGQAVSVEELIRVAPHVSKKLIYERAVRIGREHIGALVNTLAIAYVGASLPLLLLFQQSASGTLGQIINMEIFSTEIVRILIGSIGLVLAIPITTVISVWFLSRNSASHTHSPDTLEDEMHALEHQGHTH